MGLLRQRCRQPEVMDQPGLNPTRHEQALTGLSRINFLSATAATYVEPLLAWQHRHNLPRLRIVDIACGGGDVVRRLRQIAAHRGVDWQVAGCDLSPVAVDHARRAADRAGVDAQYFTHDALAGPPPGTYDAVICSLFLHHLDDNDAVRLLGLMRQTHGVGLILVSDLERGLLGLLLAHLVCRAVSRSDVVHTDGPISVRAAYTLAEARALAERAELTGCTVRRCWPCRWLMTWRSS